VYYYYYSKKKLKLSFISLLKLAFYSFTAMTPI